MIAKILSAAELQIERAEEAWVALRLFEAGPADFADYLIGLHGCAAGCEAVATFNKKAAKSDLHALIAT